MSASSEKTPSRWLYLLPNAVTLASIFFGVYAILHAAFGYGHAVLYQAALAIFAAGVCDMADGRVARMTKTQSPFGVEMDSLADVISFGVAPAVLVYKWALWPLGNIGIVAAFFYVACGVVRLARFNVLAKDGEGTDFFVGLPIPLAAAVLVALVMAHFRLFGGFPVERHWLVLSIVIGLGLLMVSTVKYWSFKHVNLGPKPIAWVFLGGLIAWLVGQVYPMSVFLVLMIGTYVIAGLIKAIMRR